MTIEECLLEIEGKAALLGYFANAAANSTELPARTALTGVSDVCDDIERLVRDVKATLTAATMSIETGRSAQRAK